MTATSSAAGVPSACAQSDQGDDGDDASTARTEGVDGDGRDADHVRGGRPSRHGHRDIQRLQRPGGKLHSICASATAKIGFRPQTSAFFPTMTATGTITSCAATMQADIKVVARAGLASASFWPTSGSIAAFEK